MNEDLTDRILQYLEIESNYAIIIHGDYGIGKTYYIKNHLFPLIERNKKFNPIIISLFGAKSIDDIINKIFLEIYPLFKTKGGKIATGLGINFFKSFSGLNLKELITDTTSDNFIDFNNILLCIDDIDRKSKNLNLIDIYGFINNLVENQNAKVILIANEDELRNGVPNEKVNYPILREKVIGISVNFNTNVSLVYDEILNSKYKDNNKNYFDFLNLHKAIIIKRIEQNKDNIRNLLFFLEHFKIIYKSILKYFETCDKTEYNSHKDEIIDYILDFTLPIAIEYKLGNLNSSNSKEIQNIYKDFHLDVLNYLDEVSVDESPRTYSNVYYDKYISSYNTHKMYFDSIFKYIIGIKAFNFELFSNELDSRFTFIDMPIPNREINLLKLNYWECIDLNYNEYRSLTYSLLKYVDKGEFPLDRYPIVFNYATRFNNIINFNLDKLILRFKKGIKKGKPNYSYESAISFKIRIDKYMEYYNELKEIEAYCIEMNNTIKEEMDNKMIASIFDIFSNDIDSFLNEIQEKDNEYIDRPIFAEFDFNKTWKVLKNISNTKILNLASYFSNNRYHKEMPNALLSELEFLKKLIDKIQYEITKTSTSKMRKVAFDILKKKINLSITNFP